jgi:hypothetical protein
VDLAAMDLEVDMRKSLHAGERLRHVAHGEERLPIRPTRRPQLQGTRGPILHRLVRYRR